MRLFFACDLSPAQKHELETIQHRMASFLPGIRWVKPHGLHITLSFLGDTDEKYISQLQNVLESVAEKTRPFSLKLGGCGVFPNPAKARVLWIGVNEGEGSLQNIKKALDYRLEGLGFLTEKRLYKPHLTLGRMRYPADETLIRRFITEANEFSTCAEKVLKLVLFESRLTTSGANYYPLAETALKMPN